MGNWRRHRGKCNDQAMQWTKPQYQKPPQATWIPTVPAWEKNFCASVGTIPWRKILEAKRSMCLFENIRRWNDSAGEEAFKNAKARFYAKINGLHCDLSLPDPDFYIDEIDWDAEPDPELVLDLNRDSEIPKDENVVILDYSILWAHLGGTAWGTGWGEFENENIDDDNKNLEKNSWEQTYGSSRKTAAQGNGLNNHISLGEITFKNQNNGSWHKSNNNFPRKNVDRGNGKVRWDWKKRVGLCGRL